VPAGVGGRSRGGRGAARRRLTPSCAVCVCVASSASFLFEGCMAAASRAARLLRSSTAAASSATPLGTASSTHDHSFSSSPALPTFSAAVESVREMFAAPWFSRRALSLGRCTAANSRSADSRKCATTTSPRPRRTRSAHSSPYPPRSAAATATYAFHEATASAAIVVESASAVADLV